MNVLRTVLIVVLFVAANVSAQISDHNIKSLRLAINDLIATHGAKYPQGREYLARLDALEPTATKQFEALRREALLANPSLNFEKLLIVRRKHVKPP
ncbi:MAG: hypothetical protein FJ388_25765, partial [Verrucomicrobia bacterium]|nr:hypothetical protein [Verrucomicrobiota bacterium]